MARLCLLELHLCHHLHSKCRCWLLVIICKARHGQFELTSGSLCYTGRYCFELYCMCSAAVIACTATHGLILCTIQVLPLVICCTARHGQNENAGAGPQSLVAMQGMARLSLTYCGRTQDCHVPFIIWFIVLHCNAWLFEYVHSIV